MSPAPPPLEIQFLSETGGWDEAYSKFYPAEEIRFNAVFFNSTNCRVNLFWKNYDGEEVSVEGGRIGSGYGRNFETFFTHPFCARDKKNRQMLLFRYLSTASTVFEGLKFGVSPNTKVYIEIHNKGKDSLEYGLSIILNIYLSLFRYSLTHFVN